MSAKDQARRVWVLYELLGPPGKSIWGVRICWVMLRGHMFILAYMIAVSVTPFVGIRFVGLMLILHLCVPHNAPVIFINPTSIEILTGQQPSHCRPPSTSPVC
jgi:hypothetical protein